MNKLSTLVKTMMLTYPSLYPTRFLALKEIFGNSGNYRWNAEGELVASYRDDRDPTVMNYSDLDEREASIAKNGYGADLEQRFLNEVKIERMQRQLREANIDLYASTTVIEPGSIDVYSLARDWWSGCRANIFSVPANAEESFREGALDFINVLTPRLHFISGEKKDDGLLERLRSSYEAILGPGVMEAMTDLAAEIMAEIRAEEADA